MTRRCKSGRTTIVLALPMLAVAMLAGDPVFAADSAVPPPAVLLPVASTPDPLRSPVAPYRGGQGRQLPPPGDEQQLRNYRTDLQNRQRELEQAPPNDTPRQMEERRELRQELDRLRRLTR